MKDWKKLVISPNQTILDIMKLIDSTTYQFAMALDHEGKLIGTVTDGDIRRAIIKGTSLQDPVSKIMNIDPIVGRESMGDQKIHDLLKRHRVSKIPIVNDEGTVVGIELLEDIAFPMQDHTVVLMVGGRGTRLHPLTLDCPKPLLKIGDKPILEIILQQFLNLGFKNFYFCVNYRAEMIESYFQNGEKWSANIRYIREPENFGTAGALGLIEEMPDKPFIVMNGDLLTKMNFAHFIQFHMERKTMASMCVKEYDMQVPYGVVTTELDRIKEIEEKPIRSFFVNAGIYCLNPEALTLIPKGKYFDMPALFQSLINKKMLTTVFPVHEFWLDIGQPHDLARANNEFKDLFYEEDSRNDSGQRRQ